MTPDLPPFIWDVTLQRRRYLLAWQRSPDGWWAHLRHVDLQPNPRNAAEIYEITEEWQPASAVEEIQGQDYSGVPRHTSPDPPRRNEPR